MIRQFMKKRNPQNKALDSFFRDLRKIKGWKLNTPLIRLDNDGDCFCPLTAVALARHSVRLPVCSYGEAADLLGLVPEQRRAIVRAADDRCADPKLRTRLLRACGLKEVEI